MTVKELFTMAKNGKVKKHHTSWQRGYVSRKADADGEYGYVKPYKGRFGKGYVWISPAWDSTTYSHITYFLTV